MIHTFKAPEWFGIIETKNCDLFSKKAGIEEQHINGPPVSKKPCLHELFLSIIALRIRD